MNLRRASSYPPDILRRQIQLTEKHHLPGLLAAALVGSMVQLDYSMRSSLIGSVCAGSVDSRSVQEYLDSKISELNFGTRRTLRFANNQKLIDCSLTMAKDGSQKESRFTSPRHIQNLSTAQICSRSFLHSARWIFWTIPRQCY